MSNRRIVFLAVVLSLLGTSGERAQTPRSAFRFELLEATIDEVHRAIQEGQITCRGLVQAYVDRARPYNGVSNALLTADGATIPQAYQGRSGRARH